jgi:hypothetical protein
MAKTNTEELIKRLEAEGFKVTKKADQFERHTFQIDREVLEEFFRVQKQLGIKVMDAIDQALRDWIKKKG